MQQARFENWAKNKQCDFLGLWEPFIEAQLPAIKFALQADPAKKPTLYQCRVSTLCFSNMT